MWTGLRGAIAWAVSCQILTVADTVWSHDRSCIIHHGQSHTREGFLQVFHFLYHSFIIWGWYNGPNGGVHIKRTLTPLHEVKKRTLLVYVTILFTYSSWFRK